MYVHSNRVWTWGGGDKASKYSLRSAPKRVVNFTLQFSWPPRNVRPVPLNKILGGAQDGLSLRKPGIQSASSHHSHSRAVYYTCTLRFCTSEPDSKSDCTSVCCRVLAWTDMDQNKNRHTWMCLHSSGGTVTTATGWKIKDFDTIPDNSPKARTACGPVLWPTQSPSQCVTGALSTRDWGCGMMLTTHLHLVPRLWMYGAIPPLKYVPQWYGALLRTEKFTESSLPLSRFLTKSSHGNGRHMLVNWRMWPSYATGTSFWLLAAKYHNGWRKIPEFRLNFLPLL